MASRAWEWSRFVKPNVINAVNMAEDHINENFELIITLSGSSIFQRLWVTKKQNKMNLPKYHIYCKCTFSSFDKTLWKVLTSISIRGAVHFVTSSRNNLKEFTLLSNCRKNKQTLLPSEIRWSVRKKLSHFWGCTHSCFQNPTYPFQLKMIFHMYWRWSLNFVPLKFTYHYKLLFS